MQDLLIIRQSNERNREYTIPLNSLRGSHAFDLPARVVQMSQSEDVCHDKQLQSLEEGKLCVIKQNVLIHLFFNELESVQRSTLKTHTHSELGHMP